MSTLNGKRSGAWERENEKNIKMSNPDFPQADLRPRRRFSGFKLVPLAALLLTLSLFYLAWHQRGIPITLQFAQGHGLKVGDTLRYRGIEIGAVREVLLTPELQSVEVKLHVLSSAHNLLRAGSQFWIVRPQVDLSGASGLDTVIGANYLRVLPGDGVPQRAFIGLENPPYLSLMPKGGQNILLRTRAQGALSAGAPVTYRQVVIGRLIQVALGKDASSVEVQAYIEPTYVNLLRDNNHFWKSSGARLDAGWLRGISLEIESVQSLVTGGVTMAIPPLPGARVADGQVYPLYDKPQTAWLDWQAHLQIHASGDANRPVPQPIRAQLSWENEGWLNALKETRRSAWVLPVEGGLLGVQEMFAMPKRAKMDSVHLQVGETAIRLQTSVAQPLVDGVAVLPYQHSLPTWSLHRYATQPEDAQIYTSPERAPRFVTADRFLADGSGIWWLDEQALTEAYWHGAPVLAASDGKLLGILVVAQQQAKVVLLPDITIKNAH